MDLKQVTMYPGKGEIFIRFEKKSELLGSLNLGWA